MEKTDAAVIGGGADGLTAAILLARAGLKTVVIEKNQRAGGRCQTREFLPGFRAPPFVDDLAPIPSSIFSALDLARRGVLTAPPPSTSTIVGGQIATLRARELPDNVRRLSAWLKEQLRLVSARAEREIVALPRARLFEKRVPEWPLEDWADLSLADAFADFALDEQQSAHLAGAVLAGRSGDPELAGSAFHLLAPATGGLGLVRGGLETLAVALTEAAREAGASLSLGLEATDIRHSGGKVTGVALADGTELETRTVISSLDFKRTFLTLFKWQELPKSLVQRVRTWRMNGAGARLLIALERMPELPGDTARGVLQIGLSLRELARAHADWRMGAMADHPPVTLRFLSAVDPSLAPPGAAVATATIGAVPCRLFDGVWTHERRMQLEERVLSTIETALPGFRARIKAVDLIVPSDIEDAIGCTDGDLFGGEIAADQMLGTRPWPGKVRGPRTPLGGLYLAGPSTFLGLMTTCGAGAAAARAALSDIRRGRLP